MAAIVTSPSISKEFVDIDQPIVFNWILQPNSIINGLQQPIARDGDFRLCAIGATCVKAERPDLIVKASQCGIRITDDNGYKLFSDFIGIGFFTPVAGNSYPFVINPAHLFVAGTRIVIDLQEQSDVTSIVQIKFYGRYRYRVSDIQAMRRQLIQDKRY